MIRVQWTYANCIETINIINIRCDPKRIAHTVNENSNH